jgi:hypothetical protein
MGNAFTMSLTAYLYVEMVGAGLLAAWFFAVSPWKGPKSLTSAIGPVLIALAAGHLAPLVIVAVRGVPYEMYVVALGFVLPLFFSLFVTTGWLLRSLVAAVGGRGGGGGGHRVGA